MNQKTLIAIVAVAIIAIAAIAAAVLLTNGNGDKDTKDVQIIVSDVTVEAGSAVDFDVKVTPSSIKPTITPANTDVYSYIDGKITGLK